MYLRSLLAGILLTLPTLAAARPVVVAVDTSRSLRPAELEATTRLLAEVVDLLPAGIELGLLAFDDAPRWVVPLGEGRVRLLSSLGGLTPAGRFTLLHDALFTAARALPAGGVILLATDGLDENSATTIEDVARLCEVNGVRIVALGVGRKLDDRALRRLALLSRGSYVGTVAGSGAAVVAKEVEAARAAVAAAAPTPSPTPFPTVAPPPAPAPPPPVWRSPLFGMLGLVAVASLGVAVALWLRQRAAARRRVCERCGAVLAEWELECARCRLPEAHAVGESQEAASAAELDEAPLDPEVFSKAPLEERLDRTTVLDEQAVVVVKEPRRVPRTFVLPLDKAFALGRASGPNTVTIADPTVSGQHLKIVHRDGVFYVVDLDSTNGTLLNGERVRSARLRPGDVIRAGEVELEFRLQYRSRLAR